MNNKVKKVTNQDLTAKKHKIIAKKIRINNLLKEVKELRGEIETEEAEYEEMENIWLFGDKESEELANE